MIRIIVMSLLMLSVSGCSLSPVKTTVNNRYVLNRVSTKVLAKRPGRLTLLVSHPNSTPGFGGNGIIYVKKPYQLHAYSKNSWVSAPAKMLLPLLAQSMRNTNYFHAVMTPPFAGLTDLRLDTQLIALQQEFLPNKTQLRLIVQATLVNNRKHKVIASRRFTSVMPSTPADPYGAVLAANKATASILSQAARFVVRSAS